MEVTSTTIQRLASLQQLKNAKVKAVESEEFMAAQKLHEEMMQIETKSELDGSFSMEALLGAREQMVLEESFNAAQVIQDKIDTIRLRRSSYSGLSGLKVGRQDEFLGRAELSLEKIPAALQKKERVTWFHTLSLVDNGIAGDTHCSKLVVKITLLNDVKETQNAIDFTVSVVEVKGLPYAFSHSVTSSFFLKDLSEEYVSKELKMTVNPVFNFSRRFAFASLTPSLSNWFCSPDTISFQVKGLESPLSPSNLYFQAVPVQGYPRRSSMMSQSLR
eukprot:TRINITY_DN9141_c2_g1_i1.p1 TRINITY_DN9141_c2_g1~~TRINITY_DN9141_c2_g1_i1.p1  ORF type:complete len:275 (+),score=43.90 TRINITY_DN9141_c2_g1_i1:89-913(+)